MKKTALSVNKNAVNQGAAEQNSTQAARHFQRKFLLLIALAWLVPPIIAFAFFPVIDLFTLKQVIDILISPLIPVFIVIFLTFVLSYFNIYINPVTAWIQQSGSASEELVEHRLRRFSVHFWGMFISYLLIAPTATILSADMYTDYSAQPIDLFRIYLVALIVSIIAGLPVFFQLFDLFGRYLGGLLRLSRPLLTIKTRVFLIGALIPLLIDTILVQYYWTSTGYFGWDTFIIWLVLELLAIASSMLFLRSFDQSLCPLNRLLIQTEPDSYNLIKPESLIPASTDELGFISTKLAELLDELHHQHKKLDNSSQIMQKREQYLSLMLNSIGDAVIATDGKGNITRMNPVAEQLTGWSFNEAQGMPVKNVFPIIDASTRQSIENPVEKVLATGTTIYLSNHTTLIARDGTEYQIADSAAPIHDENNIIQGMVLVFNDVTEQYQLREAAARSKRDLQAIMDNSPAIIFIRDTSGNFTFINRQFENLFHIKRSDITGRTLHDVFPPNIAHEMQLNDQAVLVAGHALEVEESVPHDDVTHTYLSIRFPLLNEQGNTYAICGISTDITERKTLEEALRRSQKMEAIGQISGGIAHDFNNQLGVVIGYLDFLHDYSNLDEKPRKWVDTATKATLRCMDLTRQLLAFSRRKTTEKTEINLNTLLSELKTMMARSVTPEVEVQYFPADDLWQTEINSGEFQDVLLNLIINARDAMPHGGKLFIETQNKTVTADEASPDNGLKSGDYVLLILRDTGTGMDAETLEHIFEPFFTTKPEGKGTGLGMSMVYGFAKRYGGYINIHSEPGTGTSIYLYLPRSRTEESEASARISNNSVELPRGNETILIVDDETDLLQLAAQYLSQLGYKTLTANSAAQALTILEREQPIDLLFTDVLMPGGINGYELAQQATTLKSDLRVLLTSGFITKTIAQGELTRFSDYLLSKPYRKDELAQRIRLVLDDAGTT